WFVSHVFARTMIGPLKVWARTGPTTSCNVVRDENPLSFCERSTPSTLSDALKTLRSMFVRVGTLMSKSVSTTVLPVNMNQERSRRFASTTTVCAPSVWMSSVMRFRRSRGARRTASTTTSDRLAAVMVTRPEKLLSRSVPPGSSGSVRLACSVSSSQRCAPIAADPASAQRAKAKRSFRMTTWTRSRARTFAFGALFLDFRVVHAQRAGVDGHADDSVDAERVEIVDFLLRRDASGRRHPARGGVPESGDGGDVRALHQPFRVHVRVEELVAVGFERADRLGRRERQGRLPAVDDDVPAPAVDRGDDALAADRIGQRSREGEIGCTVP